MSMDSNIGIDERLAMLINEPLDVAKFRLVEPVIGRERNWSQPELGFAILAFNVDVRRLVSFATVEMEAVRTDAQDRWHDGILGVGSEVSIPQRCSKRARISPRMFN